MQIRVLDALQRQAEQALLGALMFDNGVFERLSDRLRGSHFYEPFHQRLYEAIEDHIRQGMLAEPTILMERFKQDPAFQEFGGLRYLADLVDRAPPAFQVSTRMPAITVLMSNMPSACRMR